MAPFNTTELRPIIRKRPLWIIALVSLTITTSIVFAVWVSFISPTHTIHLDITTDPVGTILVISLAIQFIIEIILMIWCEWKFNKRRQMENLPFIELVRDGVVVKSIY